MAKRQTPRQKALSKVAAMNKEQKEKEAEDKKTASAAPAKASAERKAAAKISPPVADRVEHDSTGECKNMGEAAKQIAAFFKDHDVKKSFNLECFSSTDGSVHLHISHSK